MKTTNYIISTLLLLAFVFNIVGYDVVFRVTQYQIKKEVKRKLKAKVPSKELHTIAIPKSWLKKGNSTFQLVDAKEFVYKGEMYDIVRKKEKNNIIIFEAISDKEETELFALLDEHIKNYVSAFPQTKNKNQKLYKKIIKDYFNINFQIQYVSSISICKYNFYTLPNFEQTTLKLDPPPPRVFQHYS